MEQFRAYVQKCRSISYVLGIGFLVFINCCGFPILNLNKQWPLMMTATQIYVVFAGALFSGAILAGLFPKKKFVVVATADTSPPSPLVWSAGIFWNLAVSNTYNFTFPNTLLHMGIFLAVSMLVWFTAERKRSADTHRPD